MTDPENHKSIPRPAPKGFERRELLKRGNRLKARLAVGRRGLTGEFVGQLQAAFEGTDLLKVRLDADSPADADALAGELAEQAGCSLVQRVGRVALLYRPMKEGHDER